MTNDELHLLKNLIEIPSPSGFEENIAEFIEDTLLKFLSKEQIKRDKHNNVIVTLNYNKTKTVLLDAHLDEIGFIINNVDRWGSISLQYLGGGDSTILSARHLNILTKNGIIPAVINRKHSHLVWDEDTELNYVPYQADVDIGIRDKNEVLKLIELGNPVVYQHNFRQMSGNYFTGYGFDDKSGCFILLKVIKEIVSGRIKPSTNLVFVFSAQEESGTKLIPIIRNVNPDLIVELDVTFATDYGNIDELEREAGKCELNKGIVVSKGIGIDKNCVALIETIAKRKNIQYQTQITCVADYTSQTVTDYANNATALVFGIPLRNMHCPTEIINTNDLISGSNLLKAFLLDKKLSTLI
jgi:putative aminopeptidase FrvX